MTKFVAGQKVTIHAEGTVTEGYEGSTEDNVIRIDTEDGYFYVEVRHNLEPFLTVEEPPLPTEPGWYQSDRYPLSSDGYYPYRLSGHGSWYNARGDGMANDEMEAMMPLRKLVVAQ